MQRTPMQCGVTGMIIPGQETKRHSHQLLVYGLTTIYATLPPAMCKNIMYLKDLELVSRIDGVLRFFLDAFQSDLRRV